MNCVGDSTASAKYLHLLNCNLWNEIDPTGGSEWKCTSPCTKIKKNKVTKPKKKKEKEKPKNEYKETEKTEIKNQQYSFTSFLIPICVTGERRDYQFLYCICALRNALKILSTTLRKEGFAQLYMVGMKSEVDWEKIKANKITFSDMVIEHLLKSGSVCMVAANRKEVVTKVNDKDAPFVVIVSTSDIPLPCQSILCVGSSWLIFRRSEKSREILYDREIYHSGRRALHAGVLVNGCSTSLTVAFKRVLGIHHFIFDRRYGDFITMQQKCFMQPVGNLICFNEALYYKFQDNLQKWIVARKNKGKIYHSRYTGGWVTDGYRIFRSGGLLLCPKDSDYHDGRIHYLYKALPLAYLAERAGGKATDGTQAICKNRKSMALKTSLFLGSAKEVDAFMRSEEDIGRDRFNRSDEGVESDETSTDFE